MSDLVKALISCLSLVGVALAWAVTNFVPASTFDEHLTAEERRYVLQLKSDIRNLEKDIRSAPENEGLRDDLAELLDQLCELRPKDRYCK